MFDLTGRVALVTGASGGLGQAIARALHARGAGVALSGTRKEALEALAAELEDRAHVAPCDLADAAAIEALVPGVERALGLRRHSRQQRRRHARRLSSCA